MRIYDNITHAALVGEIGNLNLAQQANGIALQSRLVDDTGILQDLLLEADAAQQFALLTLGSMILEILAEEKLLAKIKEYLQENRYITTRILRILFGLTPYMAQKWLNHFCEKGIMEKEGIFKAFSIGWQST